MEVDSEAGSVAWVFSPSSPLFLSSLSVVYPFCILGLSSSRSFCMSLAFSRSFFFAFLLFLEALLLVISPSFVSSHAVYEWDSWGLYRVQPKKRVDHNKAGKLVALNEQWLAVLYFENEDLREDEKGAKQNSFRGILFTDFKLLLAPLPPRVSSFSILLSASITVSFYKGQWGSISWSSEHIDLWVGLRGFFTSWCLRDLLDEEEELGPQMWSRYMDVELGFIAMRREKERKSSMRWATWEGRVRA